MGSFSEAKKPFPFRRSCRHFMLIFIFVESALFSSVIPAHCADSINLNEIEVLRGLSPSIQSSSNIMFTGNESTLKFEADSRVFIFNKTMIWLNQPASKKDNDFAIAKYDADNLVTPLLLLHQKENMTNSNLTVILDPGHGGKDTGAIGPKKSYESRITLDIARRTKKILDSPQIKVKLTRKGDSSLSRAERSALARQTKAGLFISIHVNFSDNSNASGIETYIVAGPGFPSTAGNSSDNKNAAGNKFDCSNAQLAYCIHRQALDITGATDRGIRHARFDVLQDAPCPAILIECGFASNPADETNLLKKEYRQNVAKALATGIMMFLNPSQPVISPTNQPVTNRLTSSNTASITSCFTSCYTTGENSAR